MFSVTDDTGLMCSLNYVVMNVAGNSELDERAYRHFNEEHHSSWRKDLPIRDICQYENGTQRNGVG